MNTPFKSVSSSAIGNMASSARFYGLMVAGVGIACGYWALSIMLRHFDNVMKAEDRKYNK